VLEKSNNTQLKTHRDQDGDPDKESHNNIEVLAERARKTAREAAAAKRLGYGRVWLFPGAQDNLKQAMIPRSPDTPMDRWWHSTSLTQCVGFFDFAGEHCEDRPRRIFLVQRCKSNDRRHSIPQCNKCSIFRLSIKNINTWAT